MTDSTPNPVFEPETKKSTAHNCSKLLNENRESAENPSNSELSVKQWAALERMLRGKTDVAISKELKIARRTLYSWRVENQAFQEELIRHRRLQFRRAMDRVRAIMEKALDALDEQVQNPYEPTSHRAARTVLGLTKIGLAVYEESAPKNEAPI